jgi:dTDP-glucose 4,6-dehydratase
MVNLDNKTILVTGGSGFIGRNFVEFVLETYQNLKVVNFDKMGIGSMEYSPTLSNGNTYLKLSLDILLLNKEYSSLFSLDLPDLKYDYVFHFAAESHVDRSINNPLSFISNNILGISALLEYCKDTQPQARIINISTDEVYGHLHADDPPFTEDSPLNPRSPYSASKASADLIANSYAETFDMDIITTRCCNNFGPYQHDEKFIPVLIKNLINGTEIPVYGSGTNIREWIYVKDHNKSILEIADVGYSGGVYNIGTGVELTNLDMISNIAQLMKISPKIKFVEDRKGHDFRYALSSWYYTREFELEDHFNALYKTIQFYADKYAGKGK